MCVLDKLLMRLKEKGDRVLLFCQMTRMLDIVEDYIRYNNWEYCRLDGSTSSTDRERLMEEYNAPDSKKFIFILSTRAGGLGITLATANTVILYDSDWNPQMDLQAQDRAHRIGQTKPVTVYRFVCQGTIEEKIYQRAMKKLYLDAVVVQQGRLVNKNKTASKEELLQMVRWGVEEMFSTEGNTTNITDKDIDDILAAGEKKVKTMEEDLKKNCQLNLLNFSMNIDDGNLYLFEGVDYSQTPTKNVYISGINLEISEDDVRAVCTDQFGETKRVVISPERDTALVVFKKLESAVMCHDASKSLRIGNCDCTVQYGKKTGTTLITEDMLVTDDEPSKRERNKLAAEYNMQVLASALKGPKLPKPPNFHDFQFFNQERLRYFYEREKDFLYKKWQREQAKARQDKMRRMRQNKERLSSPTPTTTTTTTTTPATPTKPSPTLSTTTLTPATTSTPTPMEEDQTAPQSETPQAQITNGDPAATPEAKQEAQSQEQEKADGKAPQTPTPATTTTTTTTDSEKPSVDEEKEKADSQKEHKEEEDDSPFTPEEEEEYTNLVQEGFADWTKRDLQTFIRLCEKYGRDDHDEICNGMPWKEKETVVAYCAAFWKKGPTMLTDWDKIEKRIVKGESTLKRRKEISAALQWKMSCYYNPWTELEIVKSSASSKSKNSSSFMKPAVFTAEEDRFLLCLTASIGWGEWEKVKAEVMQAWEFRFNYFLHTRTTTDIARRMEHLMKQLEKEHNDWINKGSVKSWTVPSAKPVQRPKRKRPPGQGPPSKQQKKDDEEFTVEENGRE
eukprot:TRINITY_DN66325_c6_g8_i2.p1 TRINITY_DN66325_c6_g8~~TRINITY_DN66325_c6_g8_i2.p1  ORF type:complete len:892 (+),score=142.37 TRINITY_DN66325_c6_g8_i2:309-2678(+)